VKKQEFLLENSQGRKSTGIRKENYIETNLRKIENEYKK
jgi:hypothetical protein